MIARGRDLRTASGVWRVGVLLLALGIVGIGGSCTRPRVVEGHGAYVREAVAADQPDASKAGARMLAMGGNAVDAAVATSFALSVVRPYSCGIGGGGFMVISLADDPSTPAIGDPVTTAIDYRERAPGAITPTFYEGRAEDAARFGGAAVAIPGTVAGLLYALERYGTLDRATVLAPAIRLADEGFVADAHTIQAIGVLDEFLREKGAGPGGGWAGAEFLRETYTRDGAARVGMRIRNPGQARALRLIAAHGAAGFYEGPVADEIVRTVAGAGGILTRADLASYRATEVPALVSTAYGRTFVCMPLPSSGGICMLEMLRMLEFRPDLVAACELNGLGYVELLAEIMQHAFADRARHLADPEFKDIDIDRLLDPSYLRARAATIEPGQTHDPAYYGIEGRFPVDAGTSHLCVVDRWGNAVACTETINLEFGSRLPVVAYGFVLNDEMDDFLTRRGGANAFGLTQSERNLPAPGKRPLSSMSPTIVLDESGHVEIVAGASGGPRIITGTLQAMLNVILWDLSAKDAVDAPRFHHQWMPGTLFFEPPLWAESGLVGALRGVGYDVRERQDVGNVQLIRRAPSGSGWQAACDPRKGGAPAGR